MTNSNVEHPCVLRWLLSGLLLMAPMVIVAQTGHDETKADATPTPVAAAANLSPDAIKANTATTPATNAALTPTGYIAEYELLRDGKKEGRATRRLAPLGDGRWELHTEIKGTSGMARFLGLRVDERSQVSWRDGRAETEGYTYLQKLAFKKRERSVSVDRSGGRIISRDSRDDNADQVLALADGVHDRQSASLALADDLARGASGTLEYAVVGRHAISIWQFEVGAQESVDTPAGRFDAVLATRIRDNEDDKVTRTWFARFPLPGALGMLPVRIEQTEPGEDDIVMQLRAITAN
ncbi:MAG: DUF3108 domain-containing protein [Xanthomonadaceae bacterium]|nr:DUF3108 domain-containing protein [Xanthomonadaceae bacterium]MDP2185114.1 DUF3108 domain-containing protein [Xanthomonadales bacterium]MDZ4115524.1 DUF3108 domain-containing protein [Xanthomonadaceae bacterium]MDZ4379016.1 DUF3108 domain-containing protein [Xanthomonadaceae bacterium]